MAHPKAEHQLWIKLDQITFSWLSGSVEQRIFILKPYLPQRTVFLIHLKAESIPVCLFEMSSLTVEMI